MAEGQLRGYLYKRVSRKLFMFSHSVMTKLYLPKTALVHVP
jgi:hypothetical protein